MHDSNYLILMNHKMKRLFLFNYQSMLIIQKMALLLLICQRKLDLVPLQNRWFLIHLILSNTIYNLPYHTFVCLFYFNNDWKGFTTLWFYTLSYYTYIWLIKNKLYDILLKGKQVLLKALWVKYFIKSRNKKVVNIGKIYYRIMLLFVHLFTVKYILIQITKSETW